VGIVQNFQEYFGTKEPLGIRATVRNQVVDDLIAQGLKVEGELSYDDVANMAGGGASLEEVKESVALHNSNVDMGQVTSWYEQASASRSFDGPPMDESPIADDVGIETRGRAMPVSAQQQVEDAIAARIIETIATVGHGSINFVADQIQEDPQRVGILMAKCHQDGLLDRQSDATFKLSAITQELLPELMFEDNFNLRAASQIIKESAPAGESNNSGFGIDNGTSVQDHVPFNTTTNPDTDPTQGKTTGVDDHASYHDSVPFGGSQNDPAPGGTGTEGVTDGVDQKPRMQEHVPGSSDTGADVNQPEKAAKIIQVQGKKFALVGDQAYAIQED
jgi:hypothetical protein